MKKGMILTVDADHFPGSEIGLERILGLLDRKGIKAAFFVAGKFAEECESVIKEIHDRGHEIGCHGYSHGLDVAENFVDIGLEEQKERIEKASDILSDIINEDVKIFRAPYSKVNSNTIKALGSLGYVCDSSVTAMRFDFGFGVGNNARAFFAPTRPYHPSKRNVFEKGDSSVLEVPISAFIAPLTLSAIRTFGVRNVCYLFNISMHFFEPVVFYLHPWEVMGNDEIRLWEGIPRRHEKNRGENALERLERFIDYAARKVEFVLYRDVVGGE